MAQSYVALVRPSEVWFISHLGLFQAQVRTLTKLRKMSFGLWIPDDHSKGLNLAVTTYLRMPWGDAQCPRKGGVRPGPGVETEGLPCPPLHPHIQLKTGSYKVVSHMKKYEETERGFREEAKELVNNTCKGKAIKVGCQNRLHSTFTTCQACVRHSSPFSTRRWKDRKMIF